MLLKCEDISKAKYTITEFKLYDDTKNQLYIATFNNSDYISYSEYVFINNAFFYNFENDTTNLKVVISFRMTQTEIIKIWYKPVNTDRLIIKHFGN